MFNDWEPTDAKLEEIYVKFELVVADVNAIEDVVRFDTLAEIYVKFTFVVEGVNDVSVMVGDVAEVYDPLATLATNNEDPP